jgi:para-aminobenzoate synthetase component 1
MICRFENRLTGQALEMQGLCERHAAYSPEDLPRVFAAIRQAQAQGLWTALVLNYELGEWLEPDIDWIDAAAPGHSGRTEQPGARPPMPGLPKTSPRMTALIYGRAATVDVWPTPESTSSLDLRARPLTFRDVYMRDVQTLRDSIARGELYQANHTLRLALDINTPPREMYCQIAADHPCAHAAYIEDGTRRILSFSPELFFERNGDTLTTRPMKGTAPRHRDPEQDQQTAQDLQQSEKNRAENLMIVDLLRNDLGRIATPGSVKVERLFALEQYPSVWTLTSTISARAPEADLQTLLRALFPCGSITGAPKIAAMQKIRQLESSHRGIYCGSVGWLAPNGDCSLNVAIRTIEMHNDHQGIFGVGGGIVYDSDPALEWEECLWKSRLLHAQWPSLTPEFA